MGEPEEMKANNTSSGSLSVMLFSLVFIVGPVVVIPAYGAITQPDRDEQRVVEVAESVVMQLEEDADDFIYARLAAESQSDNGARTDVTVYAAASAPPTPDSYCVTVEVGEAIINYDSSTQEYTRSDTDEVFVCEATPAGWN